MQIKDHKYNKREYVFNAINIYNRSNANRSIIKFKIKILSNITIIIL